MINLRYSTLLAATLAACCASGARGSISPTTSGSGTIGYFGSQGTGYSVSDPATLFLPVNFNGPYPANIGLSLPVLPAPPVLPYYNTPVTGNVFAAGSGYTYNFNDGFSGTAFYTAATTTIDHAFFQGGTSTADAHITFPTWSFGQGPAAPSYAYEQINFVSQYTATTTLTASTPVFPIFISGSVSGLGSWAQFDAAMTYWWQPTNSSLVPFGAPTNLGTLLYSWVGGPGPFSTTVNNTGSLAATPTSYGILEIDGYAYVAGDPFQIAISSVPEPTSLSLLGAGVAVLLRRRRRSA